MAIKTDGVLFVTRNFAGFLAALVDVEAGYRAGDAVADRAPDDCGL
jgi:hypothetical protein